LRAGRANYRQVDPFRPDAAVIDEAAALIRQGRLVAFPTETVYGLGANALDAAAVQRIFTAKGRPGYNPLIVHVATSEEAQRYVTAWPESAARLAAAFWPGPLTLVLPKQPQIPGNVTAGLESVAIRVPAHPVALALLRAAALPIAAPSANPFTELSPTTAAHVVKGLGDRVDLILDGGPTAIGIESTVLDLSGSRPLLLRPGLISREELAVVLNREVALARAPATATATAPRPSPGMLERHYAPRAELRLFGRENRLEIVAEVRQATGAGRLVGALLLTPLEAPLQHALVMPQDAAGYARLLYAALHSLDDLACDLILVERPPVTAAWQGVRDRLERATRQ
jgi:L-threonylcarbamoyladenylate synthase